MVSNKQGQPTSRIIIRGARPLGYAGAYDSPPVADILIEDGVITAIGPDLPARDCTVIRGYDRLAVPGFVNAHYHSHDALLKGAFEALPLDTWSILALPPAFPPRSAAEVRVRTLIGAAECLSRGITTVQDMVRLHPYSAEHFDIVLAAYEEIGLRAVVAPHYNDLPSTNSAAFWDDELPASELWRLAPSVPTFASDADIIGVIRDTVVPRLNGNGLVSLGLGPSAPERCSPALLRATAQLSAEHDLPVFTHVGESRGKTLHARIKLAAHNRSHIRYLADCGLLGPNVTIAHAVWLSEEEIAEIAESGASVVLNPQGNLKTRSGIAPIAAYRNAGVNIGLGCDNCSCNDSQSMLQTMKTYASLAAVEQPRGDTPSASEALQAATSAGARALAISDLGSLAPGMKADIALFRLDDIAFVPLNSAVRQLVFGDAAPALDKVFVDGRLVVDEGRLLTVDLEALRREAEGYAAELRGELTKVIERVTPLYPALERAAASTQALEWRLDWYHEC